MIRLRLAKFLHSLADHISNTPTPSAKTDTERDSGFRASFYGKPRLIRATACALCGHQSHNGRCAATSFSDVTSGVRVQQQQCRCIVGEGFFGTLAPNVDERQPGESGIDFTRRTTGSGGLD
jgi:hypothetical protein